MNWVDKLTEKNCEGTMKYPESFKKRCLTLYPGDKRIESLVENDNFLLGKELKKRTPDKIPTPIIESATTVEQLESLKKQVKQKIRLYNDWSRLYDEQYLSTGHFIDSYGNCCWSPEIQMEYDIRVGKIKRGSRVTRAQLASLERNLEPRISQNAERRRIGCDKAGEYRTF